MNFILKYILRPKISLVAFIFFIIFATFTNGVPFIYSDGYGSYHISNCLIKELNWICKNKPIYYPDYTEHTVSRFDINVNNKQETVYNTVYSPSLSILNLPLQILTEFFDRELTPDNDYFTAINGHTVYDGISFLITAIMIHLLSVIIIYKILRELNFSESVSILATGASYFSSYAIWYALLAHGFNHNAEILFMSLSLFFYIKFLKSRKSIYVGGLGFFLGMLILTRPIWLISVPIFILGLSGFFVLNQISNFHVRQILYKFNFILKKYIKACIFFCASLSIGIIILLNYNYYSYGNNIASGYDLLFNQGFDFSNWNGINILFSVYRGWFVYTPIAFLAVIFAILSLVKIIKHNNSNIK